MKALLGRFRNCWACEVKDRCVGFREVSEAVENEDTVISLGGPGEPGLGGGCSCGFEATWWSRCVRSGEVCWSQGSDVNGVAGSGGERSGRVGGR